jgi:hypothetical protein
MKTIEDLRDISGLDPISWWPLAAGWWIVIGLVVFLALAGGFFWLRARRRARSWQAQVRRELDSLERNLTKENSRNRALGLAVLLRRLAISKEGREACASLQGKDWLTWLESKDQNRFAWTSYGQSLVSAPYAPENTTYDLDSLKAAIQAAKGWVR